MTVQALIERARQAQENHDRRTNVQLRIVPDCPCWNDPELAARSLYCPACSETSNVIPIRSIRRD